MSFNKRRADLLDEYSAECEAFVRSLPRPMTASLEELTFDHLAPWPESIEEAERFFLQYGNVFRELAQCPRVERLKSVKEFGIRRNPAEIREVMGAVATTRFHHDRWSHSKHVASHMIALCIRLEVPWRMIVVGALASLLHDVGHAAFSHDGDFMLVPNGLPDHEQRGEQIILTDLAIRRVFRLAGIDPEEVAAVVAELGRLGYIQKIMDTTGYVALDSMVVGKPLPADYSSWVIGSIRDITASGVMVTDERPLAWMIKRRGELGRDVYFLPENKLFSAAIVKVLQELYRRGCIRLEDVADGNDQSMTEAITDVLNDRLTRQQLPAWLHSATNIAFGVLQEVARWECRRFTTKAEVEAFRGKLSGATAESCIVLEPWDYTTKTLCARKDGVDLVLAAPKSLLRDRDKFYYVFTFN